MNWLEPQLPSIKNYKKANNLEIKSVYIPKTSSLDNHENNEQNSQVYLLLWIHPRAPSSYPSFYMTCPYGCHDRHLRFNMQTTWICPKLYSNLLYIIVSTKNCVSRPEGRDHSKFFLTHHSLHRNDMSRYWWWILSDILKITQLFHFYCPILVPATLHLPLYEQMAGANSAGKVI